MNATQTESQALAEELFASLQNGSEIVDASTIEVCMNRSLTKKIGKLLARCSTPDYCSPMPSQRHRDKTTFSITMSRELHMQLKKLAEKEGKSVTDLVNLWAFEKTQNISLSPEDHEQIAREIRAWESRQKGKNNN